MPLIRKLVLCWIACLGMISSLSHAGPPFLEFVDPNPNPGNQFGHSVVALSTGNVVITSPFDDAGGVDAGAVYLFNGATGGLISTLRGTRSRNYVGEGGVTALSNGNYVVSSPGAVTWGSGTTGVSGDVSASNSLVDGNSYVNVGSGRVTALSNGNYVVCSYDWGNHAGAVTWGSGSSGVSGVVSASNSLVGSKLNDNVGRGGVTALSNGNYVVSSPDWGNGAALRVGAVTWGSGSSGVTGVVSASNSLVGGKGSDHVGYGSVTALSNGNYVVCSPIWDNGAVADAGAVTWGSGSSGVSGVVSASNSLVGSTANDQVGYAGVTALSNGNYVVSIRDWDNGAASNAGAVTWGNGTTGVSGVVSASNSLVGSKTNDYVGREGVTALSNGNYVVSSRDWDNGAVSNVGAVTWGSGTTGVSGVVNDSNSLVGSKASSRVGQGGVVALSNGNYVVSSAFWHNGVTSGVGAVTWGNGTTGVSGVVSASNSLVGDNNNDQVGGGGVTALSNGNYVVRSPFWRNGVASTAGAVTWGNGSSGVTGVVSSSNSLVGDKNYNKVGSGDVTELSDGNYVVCSPAWDNGAVSDVGAVTWRSGTMGVSGVVSVSNSLVGSKANDQVGYGGVTALSNGNYVVRSPTWGNGDFTQVGAVTWGDGSSGVTGEVSASNSLVGSQYYDIVGSGVVTALSNGNYVVSTRYWKNGALVFAGAVTWGSGTTGVSGVVNRSNSLVGLTRDAYLADVVVDNVNNTFFGRFQGESSGKVRLGSQEDGMTPAPTVTLNTANLTSNATGLTITGTNFDAATPSNNTVTFTPAGTGTVTAATATTLTVTSLSGQTLGALYAVVTTDGQSSGVPVQVATLINSAPTALALNANTLAENNSANATVGSLSATDPDSGQVHTYSLVEGTGDTDNDSFSIVGADLRISVIADFETKSSYSIRVLADDGEGGVFEKVFTLTITDVNEAPTALALSNNTLAENIVANATVGTLSATDPDSDQTHTFSLVEGTGDTDNDDFSIVGTDLKISVMADYETKSSYSIRVLADDGEGGVFEKVFTLTILDVAESVITIMGKDQLIINGDTTPDAADATDFGSVALLNSPVTYVFTIANDGDAMLNLDDPAVVISGPGADDFKVTTLPTAEVAADDQTSFAITFDPLLPGLRTATVTVASDDLVNGSYSFAITGFGELSKRLTQTITFAPPKTVYLDQGPLDLSASASSGLPVTLSVVPAGTTAEGASMVENVLSFTSLGKVKVQAVQAGDGTYAAARAVVKTITVKAAPTKLTLVDLVQTYTGTPRAISTLGGSGEVMIEYKIGTTFGSTPPTNAGSYSVKATDSNGTKTGKLSIAKASIYVTPDNQRKFVGQVNPELTSVYSGFVESDTEAVFTKVPALKTTAKTTSAGGLYPITASGGAAVNYLFVYQQGTLVVESFGGSYEALLVDADDLPVGKLTLTVPLTGQSFSGKLTTATETAALSLKGSLTTNVGDELAAGTATVMKGGVSYVVSFTLPMQGDVIVTATRSGQALGSAMTGRKLLALAKGSTVLYSGSHTTVLEPVLPSAGDIPAGAGWATATLSKTGVMTLVGRLADGTAFTTTLAPDADPDPGYRLFVQPYKKRTESYLGGTFTLLPHPTLTNRRYVSEASLSWTKTGLATDATYRAGFGPVTTVMMLDPWLPPIAAKGSTPAITLSTRLGLTDSSFEVQHSDTGSTLDGNLPTQVGLNAKNVVSVQLPLTTPVNATKWKTKVVPKTGLFSGSFELADTEAKPRVVTFSGVLRQPATEPDVLIGDGHYLLPPLVGTERTTGEVMLTRP